MFDFLKLGESVASLGRQLKEVREKIESTKRQIDEIVYGPSHPDDILVAAEKWLRTKEATYQKLFSERIFSVFTSKPGRFDSDKFLNDLQYARFDVNGSDIAIVSLIGTERIMQLFKEQTAKLQPSEYGLKISERGPALELLNKKLVKLQDEERKLVDGAQRAGLTV